MSSKVPCLFMTDLNSGDFREVIMSILVLVLTRMVLFI